MERCQKAYPRGSIISEIFQQWTQMWERIQWVHERQIGASHGRLQNALTSKFFFIVIASDSRVPVVHDSILKHDSLPKNSSGEAY